MLGLLKTGSKAPAWAMVGVAIGVAAAFGPYLWKRFHKEPEPAEVVMAEQPKALASMPAVAGFSARLANSTPSEAGNLPRLSAQPIALPKNSRYQLMTPVDGQKVGAVFEVGGQTQNIKAPFERWLIIFVPQSPHAEARFYPFEIPDQGKEFLLPLQLGADIPEGSWFKVLLFITHRQGGKVLRQQNDRLKALPPGVMQEIRLQRSLNLQQ